MYQALCWELGRPQWTDRCQSLPSWNLHSSEENLPWTGTDKSKAELWFLRSQNIECIPRESQVRGRNRADYQNAQPNSQQVWLFIESEKRRLKVHLSGLRSHWTKQWAPASACKWGSSGGIWMPIAGYGRWKLVPMTKVENSELCYSI